MKVELPDAVLEGTGMTPGLAKLEVAVALYRDRKVSMRQASRNASVPRMQFQHELGRRGVTVDYDVADLHADLENLKSIWLVKGSGENAASCQSMGRL